MNILFLIEFTASMLFLWLIVFVLYKNPKAMLNRICALFLISFIIWNFFSAYYYIAEDKENAMFWLNLTSAGWCSFPSLALLFALVFTRKDEILKKWYLYLILILITVFFIYKQWTGYLFYDNIKESYGWSGVWSNSIWSFLYYVYYFSFIIISITLCLSYVFICKNNYERKQAGFIVISSIIPVVLGSVTDILFPNIGIISLPQLGSLFTLIWAGGIVYAITRYGLMTLTPAYAAGDILKTMSDSLILVGIDGNIIEINNAALNMLGYSRNEVVGNPFEILFKFNPGTDFNDNKSLKADSFKNRQESFRSKNGGIIPVSISSSVMHDENGTLAGIVYVARDMREFLRLQEQERGIVTEKARNDALQDLARELQEAYDKLREAQSILFQSEKMSAVGQLAGGIAHEINNPMGVILGFSQSIVKRIEKDDQLYMPLKSIEREAIRCKKLVADLLAFSRTAKNLPELIDINHTIDETLSLIESQTKLMNIKIWREFKTGLPTVAAIKNQIQQVVVSICTKAIDSMPEGGVITIATKQSEKNVIIEISNTGKMNEDEKKHIFEPFYSGKKEENGPGLGLCLEIIRKHQGNIEIDNKSGKETAFRVKLPINRKPDSDIENYNRSKNPI